MPEYQIATTPQSNITQNTLHDKKKLKPNDNPRRHQQQNKYRS